MRDHADEFVQEANRLTLLYRSGMTGREYERYQQCLESYEHALKALVEVYGGTYPMKTDMAKHASFGEGITFATRLVRAALDESELDDPDGQPFTGWPDLNQLLSDIRAGQFGKK